MISLCTLFDRNYLSKGLALIESLQLHHGDAFELFVLALDEATERAVSDLPQVWVTSLAFLETEYTPTAHILQNIKPQRSVTEYYWTLTPFFTEFSLPMSRTGAVAYVDADCYVLHSLDVLYREVENARASVAITPHRFSEARQRTHGNNGTFNVGWVYFKDDAVGKGCLQEWADLCQRWCYQRTEKDRDGRWRFGDQAYWDGLVPKYGVHAVKNAGVNLAPWNVENYVYQMEANGRLYVIAKDGAGVSRIDTLALYHFHAHTFDAARGSFHRGGYPLPELIARKVYEPYEQELRRITKELNLK